MKGTQQDFVDALKKATGGDFDIQIRGADKIALSLKAKDVHGVDLVFSVFASFGFVSKVVDGKLMASPYQE